MRTYPTPKGSVTKFGYRRITQKNRRQKFEHVIVWEAQHGPVPPGMEIHHVNGDKLDNRIENLRLVTRLEHKRIHSGCQLRSGVWWKQCRRCEEFKPLAEFYQYPGRNGVMGICKPCCSRLAVEYKRKRRLRALAVAVVATGIIPPMGDPESLAATENAPAAGTGALEVRG